MEELIEQQQPEPKKSRLFLIVVLALSLATGGFFAMRAQNPKVKPEPKLGEIVDLPKEFLVPLRGQGSYLRTDIALHLDQSFDAEDLAESMAAARHTINMTLMEKSLREIDEITEIRGLQSELATELNKILDPSFKPGRSSRPRVLRHPEWDSQVGPVLKVYFTTFATQYE